jgi:hypothetical protein
MLHGVAGSTVLLRRRIVTRLAGGARLQLMFPTYVCLFSIRLAGQLTGSVHDPSLPLPGTVLVILALVGATAIGATGWARFDDRGLAWRYYRSHRVEWHEITKIALVTKRPSHLGFWFNVEIWSGGRRRRMIPAGGGGLDHRTFGRALLAEAASRGIAVEDDWPDMGLMG